jgi:hypothetical protein
MIPQASAQASSGNNRFPHAAAMMQRLSQPIWLLIDDRCDTLFCSFFDMSKSPYSANLRRKAALSKRVRFPREFSLIPVPPRHRSRE